MNAAERLLAKAASEGWLSTRARESLQASLAAIETAEDRYKRLQEQPTRPQRQDDDHGAYLPTPEEIERETAKIRARWSDAERQLRYDVAHSQDGWRLAHGCKSAV